MSVVVLKRKFEAPPSKDEILGLVAGNVGDHTKAKSALLTLLAPMKDLLALLEYVETIDMRATQLAEIVKEQDGAQKETEDLKAKVVAARAQYEATAKKVAQITTQIADLEAQRDAVKAQVESEEQAKLRVNKTVSDEYDRLRAEMFAKVADEEAGARKNLREINAKITAAAADLESLHEKRRQFIASLG